MKISVPLSYLEEHLHLPMKASKFDRFSISRNLRSAVNFAKLKMSLGKKLLVCFQDGEDIRVCVCLAILVSLFNEAGDLDGAKYFEEKSITKMEMRRMLIFICKYAVNARPSRGNLRQAFGFLSSQRQIRTAEVESLACQLCYTYIYDDNVVKFWLQIFI